MTVEQMTARINELYHKSQAEGLSEAEKEEQHNLRQAYVANVRANLRGQLNHISIVEKDGTITNLRDKKKAKIRAEVLRLRDTLTEQERLSCSREIVKKLTTLACYRDAEVILAYVNYRSEVETTGLIGQALSEDKLVFVPRVTGRDMEFYQIADLNELHEGYRGILEPEGGRSYPDYLLQTDRLPHTLLCMPGAAFDRSRHRIGYGGGFYDRYLERLNAYRTQNKLPLATAALAYSCQVREEIPWESHDVIPDILLTEKGSIQSA